MAHGVPGDEVRPVCGLCSSKGLFCTRSDKPITFVQHGSSKRKHGEEEGITGVEPTPREALTQPDVAGIFHHYISCIAAWYDLGDPARQFATLVPRLALDEPLLFSGAVAVAAMHLGKTTGGKAALVVASTYHAECVAKLIALGGESPLLENGVALATVCLLRSYEILDEDVDPNRHLQGAYSLASRRGLLNDASNLLFTAGFWNYLREDITFSLFEGCTLKMDVSGVGPLNTGQPGHLHDMSLILGRLINATFERPIAGEEWTELAETTAAWYKTLAPAQKPFARIAGAGGDLAKVWFLEDSHASAMHYFLTACCILATSASPTQFAHLPLAHDEAKVLGKNREDLLEEYASEICAIAFTTRIPSVLVNAFGPISFNMLFPLLRKAPRGVVRPLHLAAKSTYTTAAASRLPAIINPSAEELANRRLGARNLERAVRHVHLDGLVVVNGVAPHAELDFLNARMVDDARELQARGENGPFNYNQGNLQLDAPPVSEYFFPSIFANPIATQVTSSVLGPRPKWTFCSANAAMPPLPDASPQRQPVHSDADFAFPSHPFALVVNVPLISMDEHNGSTEIWLGTHTQDISAQEGAHGDRASGRIKEQLLVESGFQPVQPKVDKGAVVIRDLRLWHAGMPNRSADVRIMLAMIHFAPWYRNKMRLELGEDVRPLVEGLDANGELGLQVPVDWVSRDEALQRYMNRGFGNSYDFNQEA
ncbi:calcineurin-like phosphoesterase [Purpureocillium lavendulum]|uniref:Calcineurin-like phosphoesterase n=1 Tax=Purpureocillium lavendulum TaxID=1247861 RepID=A0AB34FFB4_9HYPO|nr:calcineurin-like phosphoesterase [Purpureocillium lavendulum]